MPAPNGFKLPTLQYLCPVDKKAKRQGELSRQKLQDGCILAQLAARGGCRSCYDVF